MHTRPSNATMAQGAAFFVSSEDIAAYDQLPLVLRVACMEAHLPIAAPSLLFGFRRRLAQTRGDEAKALAWHRSDLVAALAAEREAFSNDHRRMHGVPYGSTGVGVSPLIYDGFGMPSRHPPRPIGKPVLRNRGRGGGGRR